MIMIAIISDNYIIKSKTNQYSVGVHYCIESMCYCNDSTLRTFLSDSLLDYLISSVSNN